MKKTLLFCLFISLALLLAACNLPTNDGGADAVQTAAAQTVSAQQTINAAAATSTPEPSNTPEPTNTSAPTNTGVPSATPTQDDCDAADFVTDVTVPDGTDFSPGESFTKTWRLRNVGSCTWTTDYDLVFISGNAMGGPASQALTANVAPGSTVDISVDLTAPASNGDYRGDWKLRNAGGVVFGLPDTFYVEIDVVGGGGAGTTTVTIEQDEEGSVRSDGTTNANPNTGDTSSNAGSQAFVSFDLSGIPNGSTIIEVKVDFTDYDTLGDPFGGLGCLRGYPGNFFDLNAGDYDGGVASGAVLRWCNTAQLDVQSIEGDLKTAVQAALAADVIELRLRFNENQTDTDGVADMVRFGDVKLIIIYEAP